MSKEILSLLSPRSADLRGLPREGKPELTWEMVSQVLSRLPDHISAYARMKYNGEYRGEGYGTNFHITLDAVRVMSGLEGIHERMRADKFLSITRVALLEAISGGQICPVCNGTGQRFMNNTYSTCSICSGEGRLRFTKNVVAKLCGNDFYVFYS